MDDDPVAYVVLRGEDESTSCVLYRQDVVNLEEALRLFPSCSPTQDQEISTTKERLSHLFNEFG